MSYLRIYSSTLVYPDLLAGGLLTDEASVCVVGLLADLCRTLPNRNETGSVTKFNLNVANALASIILFMDWIFNLLYTFKVVLTTVLIFKTCQDSQ